MDLSPDDHIVPSDHEPSSDSPRSSESEFLTPRNDGGSPNNSVASEDAMDASWVAGAASGDYKAAPGVADCLMVYVVDPATRAVVIVCSVHKQLVKSVKHHVAKHHKNSGITEDLFRNFNVLKELPVRSPTLLALPCVDVFDALKCLIYV
jgi:hypothetical protein